MTQRIAIGFVLVFLATVPLGQAADSDGFVPLFDGKTLAGWEQKGGKAVYSAKDGVIFGQTVPNTGNSFLCTKKHYSDYVLEYEYKCDNTLNSGVPIRSNQYDTDKTYQVGDRTIKVKKGRVHGYQVEIDPNKPGRMWSGGIYDEGRRGWLYPGANGGDKAAFTRAGQQAHKPGEWNKVRVECKGDSINTWLNGEPRAKLKDGLTAEGFIGLQVHGVGGNKKKMYVQWRNLRIKELKK